MYFKCGKFEFRCDRVKLFHGLFFIFALAPFGGAILILYPRFFCQFLGMNDYANTPDWAIDLMDKTGGRA